MKYPRIEFRTGELLFVLPIGLNPDTLWDKHRNWIHRKTEFIKECLKETPNKKIIERTEKKFRDLIHSFAKKASKELGENLNKVFFRTMRTKWASCSSKRNLTVNKLMKYLPEHLLKYVTFHEIAHLKEKRHNDKFWKIISKEFSNYHALERDLFIYWFQIANAKAEFSEKQLGLPDIHLFYPVP